MARSTLGTIGREGEKKVLLGVERATWVLRAGTDPVIESFEVMPSDVEALTLMPPNDVTIELSSQLFTAAAISIKKLTVLRGVPGPNKDIGRILVADRRWQWPYKHILRRYNMRRRVGIKRRKAGTSVEELQPVTEDIAYAPASVHSDDKGNVIGPWTVKAIIEDILVKGLGIPSAEVNLEDLDQFNALSVENVVIDDNGANAVAKALALIPGAAVVIDKDGKVQVFNLHSGADIKRVKNMKPELVAGGHIAVVRQQRTRPKEVHVFFTREVELRFDFIDDGPPKPNETIPVPDPNSRFMDNVLPSPDFEITIDGKDISQGTWITIDQAIKAWGSFQTNKGQTVSITKDLINRAFIPELGLWASLGLVANVDISDPKADWPARLRMLELHYRQTFRINRRWIDRILSMKAYLVGTIDPTSGQRAPSLAFADYALKASQKSFMNQDVRDNDQLVYAWNISNSYPQGPLTGLITNVKSFTGEERAAPAKITIIDEDQGIISVSYVGDSYGYANFVFPSKLDNVPSRNPVPGPTKRISGQPLTLQHIKRKNLVTKLSASHRLALIITAVPAGPNDKSQLHRIRVKPRDIMHLLPESAKESLDKTPGGPVKEIRIGASVETARIMWGDSASDAIDRLFSVGSEQSFTDRKAIDKLIVNGGAVNRGISGGVGGASLEDIAQAAAARVYTMEADHLEGDRTTMLDQDAKVVGKIVEVAHSIEVDGSVTTVQRLKPTLPGLDLFAFLNDSTRAVILKEVQPKR